MCITPNQFLLTIQLINDFYNLEINPKANQ
jgi:hypothetical protein